MLKLCIIKSELLRPLSPSVLARVPRPSYPLSLQHLLLLPELIELQMVESGLTRPCLQLGEGHAAHAPQLQHTGAPTLLVDNPAVIASSPAQQAGGAAAQMAGICGTEIPRVKVTIGHDPAGNPNGYGFDLTLDPCSLAEPEYGPVSMTAGAYNTMVSLPAGLCSRSDFWDSASYPVQRDGCCGVPHQLRVG